MRREINDRDIERLFEKVIQQPPIINDEKVHSLLYHSPEQAIPGNPIKHFIKTHLNLIVMSTIIFSLLISTVIWTNFGKTQKTDILSGAKNKQQDISLHNVPAKDIKTKDKTTGLEDYQTEKRIVMELSRPKSDSVLLNKNNETSVQVFLPVWDNHPVSGDEYVLELSKEELEKLGVILTDSAVYYLNISPNGLISGYNRPYYALQYKDGMWVKNSKRRKSKKAKNEDMVSFHSFYMYYSTNDQIINSFNNIEVCFYNELKQAYPKLSEIQSCYTRKSEDPQVKKVFSIIDSLNENTERKSIYDFLNMPLKSVDDTLVPIVIHYVSNDPVESTKILWFVTNDNFYNALPQRYQKKVRNFYEAKKLLKKRYPDANLVDYPRHYEFNDYMENLNYIDLSREELEKIGIRFKNDTGKYSILRTGFEYRDENGHTLWCKSPYNMSMSGRKVLLVKLNLYAPYQSGFKSKVLSKLSQGANDSALKMKELIPVRVKQEQFKDYCPWLDEDQIFWYAPTEAFFDSLPPRIGNELKQDYRTIMIRRDPNVPLEEKMKLTSSCKYFEECKATLFDVSFTISPNPVSDNLNLDLDVQLPDKISISIFSVGGRKLITLLPFTNMPVGPQHLSFPVSNLASGFYLVTVQNGKGLVKTQRIIKL
ncbi:MAG TPA: T9SS type A sorting domain-containing protein [Bacteroidales bacterium]